MLIVLAFGTLSSFAYADRGGFSPLREYVYETGQKAIIAWNGTDEILILSTDVSSGKETTVIELMPLPSNPVITKGENQSFSKVTELVNTYFTATRPRFPFFRNLDFEPEYVSDQEKVIITFQDVIGIHFLTVVFAEEADDLTTWLRDFLVAEGYSTELPSDLDELISYYMQNEMHFFVIDAVDTSLSTKTVDTLKYEFRSSVLYYPLRISSLFSGDTDISLFAITSNKLHTTSVTKLGFKERAQFQIKKESLTEIDTNLTKLFSSEPYLYYFRFGGSLESFDRDIFAHFQIDPAPAGVVVLAILVLGSGFVSLVLFFPANKVRFLNMRKAGLPVTRRLEIVALLLSLVGIILFWSGACLPWRLVEYGAKGEVLLAISGLYEKDMIMNPLIFFPLLALILSYVYLLLVQRNSRSASVVLAVAGVFVMLQALASCCYYPYTMNIGILTTLTGCSFIFFGALFSLWRIKLLPTHVIEQTGGTEFETYIIRRFLVYIITLIVVALILFWIYYI